MWRVFHAFRERLSTCPRLNRLVCKAFCTFRVLFLRKSLVLAYMSRAFCTTAKRDYYDEGVWDADNGSASDLDMTRSSPKGKGRVG